MINYNKIENLDCMDLVADKKEYVKLFDRDQITVKEFCQKYLDSNLPITRWYKFKRLKYEFVEKYLIPYLIEIGALLPSMQDSINYALISIPNLGERHYEKKCDAKIFCIKKAGEIYFDKNGEIVERGKNDLSAPNVRNMTNYYNYIKECDDCDPKWLKKIEKTLKDYGIISEKNQSFTI